MTNSQQRAKWILVLACLVLAFCLVQRSVNLLSAPTAPLNASSLSQNHDDASGGEKICGLSAKSLNAAAPMLDVVLPFLLMLMAIIANLSQSSTSSGYRRALVFPPLRRRHLTFCVFRE